VKPALLFLCHRIPYPPNKGDKIRSYHLLKHLSKRYRVFLAAFVDDQNDWKYQENVDRWCEETYFVRLNPLLAKIRSLKGFILGGPLTIHYYHDQSLSRWLRRVVDREGIEQMLIYSSSMAQYVLDPEFARARRFMDFVDVDSDKWQQYAAKKTWPLSWVFRREAKSLQQFEQKIANNFDASFLVSQQEAELFRRLVPSAADKISYFRNGVDVDTFSPLLSYANPYQASAAPVIVFTGAMDYWPNEDAVTWFSQHVFKTIKQRWPEAQFYIVGSRPSQRVLRLASIEGVCVTGRVPDVRPYLHYATAIVVPIHIARGIQNKILEAMAMAKPVVVTSMGLEGIDADDGTEVLVADQVDEFIEKLSWVFHGKTPTLGSKARKRVCKEFSWESSLPELDKWMARTAGPVDIP
jgi:sugar transferase (PEP-CTERM/EpsH1 system associated)